MIVDFVSLLRKVLLWAEKEVPANRNARWHFSTEATDRRICLYTEIRSACAYHKFWKQLL